MSETSILSATQTRFLRLAIERNALRFGEFTLKSGRSSPYFFNAGLFSSGRDLGELGQCYANTLLEQKASFDMLFGPAYKGIPLATASAIALDQLAGADYPVCYNRKEAKTHGEGGQLVGAPLKGKVLIVDDVITAGTAIRESIDIILQHDAIPAGVVVALDRQERGKSALSAIQEVEQEYRIPVYSIVNLNHLIEFIKNHSELTSHLEKMANYRSEFGVNP